MNLDALQIRYTHDLAQLEGPWKALEDSGFSLPYQSYHWIYQLTHCSISPTLSPRYCYVTIAHPNSEHLLCILPFMITKHHGVNILQWVGDKHSNHQGGLYEAGFLKSLSPDAFRILWKRILLTIPPFDIAWLSSQSATWLGFPSPFASLGHKLCGANTYNQLVFPHHDWKTLAPTLRSKKARKRMRNEENRLSREADISWKTLDSADEVEHYLPILFQQRLNRLNELGIPAENDQDAYLSIYRNMLLQSVAESNEKTSMLILKADDEMIAGVISFEWQGVIYPLLISMTDSRYRQWSPGEYLLRLLFQKACDRQVKMVDIGPGDQDYKTSWCNQQIEQFETVKPETLKGHVAALLIRTQIHLKRTIKNNPRLWELFVKLRKSRSHSKYSGKANARHIQELG